MAEKKEKNLKEKKKKKEKPKKNKSEKKIKINFSLKKLLNNFKRIKYKNIDKKKKIIFLTLIIVIIVVIILLNIFVFNKDDSGIIQASRKDFQVIIPDGAFGYDKKITVTQIPKNSLVYQNISSAANFHGDIFEIKSSDGRRESSLMPMIIRYRIPENLYFGDNFINFSLGRISPEDNRIINEVPGSRIVEINGDHFLEAQTFYFSKYGLILRSPQEAQYGLRQVVDRPPSIEPDIILISCIDNNFLGNLTPAQRGSPVSDNIWSILFPDRNIWVYNYPLTSTRSKVYNDSYLGFIIRTGIRSPIEFEGRRLIQELKRLPNRDFDIITHGIGGLIARYAIETDPTIRNISNIVMISTPNEGTNLANPVYFNMIYGKDPTILSQSFSIEEITALEIQKSVNLYLRNINNYYLDLIPNSPFLNKLNSLELRKDINYLNIAGNKPDISENFINSPLSNIYPELLFNLGDGVVSIESALLDNSTNMLFDKNFFSIYSDSKVLNEIQIYLEKSIERTEIKEFEDDFFVETQADLLALKDHQEYKLFSLPTFYTSTNIIELERKIGFLDSQSAILRKVKNNIFIETINGIYDESLTVILDKRVIGGVVYNNKYFVTTDEGIYFLDDDNTFSNLSADVSSFDESYYIENIGLINIRQNQNFSEVYINDKLVENRSRFRKIKVIEDAIFLVFNDKIAELRNENLISIITRNDLRERINVGFSNFKDYYYIDNYHFILTHDYKLFLFDSSNLRVQLIGDSDIGNTKLIKKDRKLYIVGLDTITYIDLNTRIFLGNFQRLSNDLNDMIFIDNKSYILFHVEGGLELWSAQIEN